MSGFSRAPRPAKGAIVGYDLFNPLASVIVFGYNPTTLSRTLQPRTSGQDGSRSEVLRLAGPPVETLRLRVHLNAADQLETGDPLATSLGIHPQLAALEMLLYPKIDRVRASAAEAATGALEILPPEAPFTLFVWGPRRVLPVRIESFSVEEQQFDPSLNPILAEVDLSLRVLTTDDFPATHRGWSTFVAHHAVKEALAVVGSASGATPFPSFLR